MNTKTMLMLSKLKTREKKKKRNNDPVEIWAVVEYDVAEHKDGKSHFTWKATGRNTIFKSREEAILKLAIEGHELYEVNYQHKLHAFDADIDADLTRL